MPDRYALRAWVIGSIFGALVFGSAAEVAKSAEPTATDGQSAGDQARAAAMAASPARFDQAYGYKGWDFPFPSFGDTLLQDDGGWRSALASAGFGFMVTNFTIGAANMLNVPRSGPTLPNSNATSDNPNAAPSRQQYFGQSPDVGNTTATYLTYDTSRWGIPDGQIQFGGQFSRSTNQHYVANSFSLNSLNWYQTLFDKALELKIGLNNNGTEWAGTIVGGNFASPFGPTAFIPYAMGLTPLAAAQPTARVTWHINDKVYDQAGLMRSMPVNGPSGDILFDDLHLNPTGLRFTVPNGGLLAMNEFGYKTLPAPFNPSTWIRAGVMYNNSSFPNFVKGLANPEAFSTSADMDRGTHAEYVLADQQILQTAPRSAFTAYRGLYIGGTFMYAPPQNLPITQYYEARLYYVGMGATRPFDQLSIVYTHNTTSKYAGTLIDQSSSLTGLYFHRNANTLTASYTAKIRSGVYATAGLSYADNPSFVYSKGEGSDLAFVYSLFLIF